MLEAYKKIEKERAELGIPPEPLDAEQTADLVELIKENSDDGELLPVSYTHLTLPTN